MNNQRSYHPKKGNYRSEAGNSRRRSSSPRCHDSSSLMKTEESTAYHEAGHVVVAIRLGIPFSSATIVPGEDYLGMVMSSAMRRRGQRLTDLDQKHIMWDIAGPLCERMYTGYEGDFAEPEITRALDICEGRMTVEASVDDGYIGGDAGIRRLERLIKRTRRILDADWHIVEHVAQALLQEQTLSRQKIRSIVERAKKSRQRRQ